MSTRLQGRTVLVVDDDRDVLEAVGGAFEAEGAEAILAADGNEGVRLCLEHAPDLVVLDMMLPGRSGFLALEKIKGREDSPLVIMITANEGKRHRAYAESLGVDAYVQKPAPLGFLLDMAVRLVEGRPAGEHSANGKDA